MTTRLDPEFKAKWLKALRGGDYQQGTNHLRGICYDGGYNYCCLGVACNIISPHWLEDEDTVNGEATGRYHWIGPDGEPYETDGNHLPFVNDTIATELISMNDENRDDFKTIAAWIEENL